MFVMIFLIDPAKYAVKYCQHIGLVYTCCTFIGVKLNQNKTQYFTPAITF